MPSFNEEWMRRKERLVADVRILFTEVKVWIEDKSDSQGAYIVTELATFNWWNP